MKLTQVDLKKKHFYSNPLWYLGRNIGDVKYVFIRITVDFGVQYRVICCVLEAAN